MENPTLKSGLNFKGSYVLKRWCSLTGKLLEEIKVDNLIVLSSGHGADIVTRQLGNDTTYSMPIDSAEIGTGTTAPAVTDTNLATPVLTGIDIASYDISTPGTVIVSIFIADADLANGTYKEFALRCGSRLFARSLITPNVAKGTNQNLTVDYTISLA